MNAYGWNNAFSLANAQCVVRHSNAPPDAADWGTQDDTLQRQGGHGICKGLATAWVIGLLNGVNECSDVVSFANYFHQVLRFQGTYIKDFGRHMDSHLVQLSKMKASAGLRLISQVRRPSLVAGDLVGYNWGAYASVWKHDIGFGRRAGRFYIMEPNFGLFRYDNQGNFLTDTNLLIEARRNRKHKGPGDEIGLWFYGKAA